MACCNGLKVSHTAVCTPNKLNTLIQCEWMYDKRRKQFSNKDFQTLLGVFPDDWMGWQEVNLTGKEKDKPFSFDKKSVPSIQDS